MSDLSLTVKLDEAKIKEALVYWLRNVHQFVATPATVKLSINTTTNALSGDVLVSKVPPPSYNYMDR
jgi:hypothetical protein